MCAHRGRMMGILRDCRELIWAILIIENGDIPFVLSAFGTAVKDRGFHQRSDQLVSVRRPTNSDRAGASVMEMAVCNVDECLKIPKEFVLGSLREGPKITVSFDLRGEIHMHNPLAPRGFDMFAEFS